MAYNYVDSNILALALISLWFTTLSFYLQTSRPLAFWKHFCEIVSVATIFIVKWHYKVHWC